MRPERENDVSDESIPARSTNTVAGTKAKVLVLRLVGVNPLRVRRTREDAMAEKGRCCWERGGVESEPLIPVREGWGVTELDLEHNATSFAGMASIQNEELDR